MHHLHYIFFHCLFVHTLRWALRSTIDELCCICCVIRLKVCLFFFNFSKWNVKYEERDGGADYKRKRDTHLMGHCDIYLCKTLDAHTQSSSLKVSRFCFFFCVLFMHCCCCWHRRRKVTILFFFPPALWHSIYCWYYLSLDQFTNNSMEFHMQYARTVEIVIISIRWHFPCVVFMLIFSLSTILYGL